MHDGQLILAAGALLAAGLLASLLAGRVRVPSLLLFLGVGMAIGTDGLGWIDFNDYSLARTIGIVALALILFEGGLTSGLFEIRPVLPSAVSLAVVGTVVTAVVTGLAAAWLLDLSTLEGLLMGAVLASTDGAAIFALLRNSTLERKLASTLEAESGFNDPMAVLLVLGFIAWLQEPGYGLVDMAGAARAADLDRPRGGRAGRRPGRCGSCAACGSTPAACTRSRRSRRRRSRSAARTRSTARASSPCT